MSAKQLVALYFVLVTGFTFIEGRKSPSDELQCKDENNRPVDWFVMYKIPRIRESSNPTIRQGSAYLYITSETLATGWKLSDKDVTMKDSIPGNTLAPLYNDKSAAASTWVLYNDQSPDSNSSNAKYGHTKGVVMASGQQGFWLVHSVPGFPASPKAGMGKTTGTFGLPNGAYAYPETGKMYGQSFLCISVNADQVDVIARQLMYNQIIPYRKNLPAPLAKKYPVFANASNEARIKEAPYNRKATILSTAGAEFVSFAKSDKFLKDLYDDFVSHQLNVDLLAETWLNGRGKLPSVCHVPRVMNVKSVVLKAVNVDFTSSRDHSKWAVSATKGKQGAWVCIGDINRADTQFSRGGGTVCLNSPELWSSYRNAVNDVESCPRSQKVGIYKRVKNWFTSKWG